MENNVKLTKNELQAAKNLVAAETEKERLDNVVIALKNFFFNPQYYNRGPKTNGHWVPAQDEQIRNRFYEVTPEMIDAMAKDYPAIANRMGEMMKREKYDREEVDRCYRNIDVLNAKLQVYEHMTGANAKYNKGNLKADCCEPCDF